MLQKTLAAVLSICFFIALGASTPAKALDADAAIALCDKNPNCGWSRNPNNRVVDIKVKDPDGGDDRWVECQPNEPCTIIFRLSQPKKKGVRGMSVVKILTGPARSSPPSEGLLDDDAPAMGGRNVAPTGSAVRSRQPTGGGTIR